MFRIGDLVVGNYNNNSYLFTNERSLSIVIDIYNEYRMRVITLEGNNLALASDSTRDEVENIEEFLSPSPTHSEKTDISKLYIYSVMQDKFHLIDSLEKWEEIKTEKNIIAHRNPYYDEIVNYFNLKGDIIMNTTTTTATEIEAPSAIDLTGEYNITPEQEEYITSKMKELYDEYYHINTEKGIKIQWEEYKENKSPVLAFLSNHPKFDPEVMGIVLEGSYERKRDSGEIKAFCDWCRSAIRNWGYERQYKYYCCTVKELADAKDRLESICNRVEDIIYCTESGYFNTVTVNGLSYKELNKEKERVYSLWRHAKDNSIRSNGIYFDVYTNDYNKFINAYEFIDMIQAYEGNIADEEFAEKANKLAKPFNFEKNGKTIGLGAVKGKKISRIVQEFFKNYGLNKIIDKRTEAFRDGNGNFHTRTKDYGWNSQYGKYADAVNPLQIKRWTIISANFLDYLTMSFGNTWQSCHTIDKTNKRGIDSTHNYSGMYCSGTLSYALDGNSIIMYTVDEKYKGKEFWNQPKINRCMFHIGEDKIVQGRLYPDGRDGGDNSLSAQFRNIVQKVIADCAKEANLWKLVKGSNTCYDVTETYGTHYKDYLHYDDCTVSYLKRNGIKKNTKMIPIGHNPICPYCGEEHHGEEQLVCSDCLDKATCYSCGCTIDEENRIYDEDSGHYFCCESCAADYGVHYCENVEAYHSEDIYCDNYTDEWFYDYYEDDCVHFTYRGEDYHYLDEDNAELDGFHCVNGDWYHEDDNEIVQCANCDEWIHIDDVIEVDGKYYCPDCAPEEETEDEIA